MRVKITKAPIMMVDGAENDNSNLGRLSAYGGDETSVGGRKAGWNKSKYYGKDAKLEELAKKTGYKMTDKSTNKDFQKHLLSDEVAKKFPYIRQAIDYSHNMYGDPNSGGSWDDGYFGVRWDPVFDAIDNDKFDSTIATNSYKPKETQPFTKTDREGNDYHYLGDEYSKNMYKKKNLPLYQAAPELANFANAQNTYGYYTPDFTHSELNPQKLNIQPQLEDVDSSLNALYANTTGDPAVDAARRNASFAEGLKAKQTAFGRKQNYDADSAFLADKYNMAARTGEQNLDAEYTSKVHNDYRALAKDAAATERMYALQNLSKKTAMNAANENLKALYLNNSRIRYDENGNLLTIKNDPNQSFLSENPYGTFAEDEDIKPIDPAKGYLKPGDPGFVGPVQGPILPGNPNFVGPIQGGYILPGNPNFVGPIQPAAGAAPSTVGGTKIPAQPKKSFMEMWGDDEKHQRYETYLDLKYKGEELGGFRNQGNRISIAMDGDNIGDRLLESWTAVDPNVDKKYDLFHKDEPMFNPIRQQSRPFGFDRTPPTRNITLGNVTPDPQAVVTPDPVVTPAPPATQNRNAPTGGLNVTPPANVVPTNTTVPVNQFAPLDNTVPSVFNTIPSNDVRFNPTKQKLRTFGTPVVQEEGGFAYDPSYMMPMRPIKKAKSLDKYFLPK